MISAVIYCVLFWALADYSSQSILVKRLSNTLTDMLYRVRYASDSLPASRNAAASASSKVKGLSLRPGAKGQATASAGAAPPPPATPAPKPAPKNLGMRENW